MHEGSRHEEKSDERSSNARESMERSSSELGSGEKFSWSVRSYQVPVPLGDCSFHFLVKKFENKLEPKIETAIIVDGGKNYGEYSACDIIEETLRQVISNDYAQPGKQD